MRESVTSKVFWTGMFGFFTLLIFVASQAVAEGDAGAGAKVYNDQNCRECHGERGQGDGYVLSMLKVEVKMHDWTDKAVMAEMTDEYLADITVKGGEALGKSDIMLSYADKLSDEQVTDLVAFVRSLAR